MFISFDFQIHRLLTVNFTLRQIPEHRLTFRRPTILVFLDLKAAFDSVDRNTLWYCLSQKDVPSKFVNLIKSLYSQSRGWVRVYDILSLEFTTKNGVHQSCPAYPFLHNFVMDALPETASTLSPHSGVELLPGGTVPDLEYADDVVLLSEEPGSLQDLLCSLDKSAAMFGMHFAPPKREMMLQDWVGVTPNLSIKGQFIERVDKFTYLGSCINPDGSIAEELSSRIQKARLIFSNLYHLWRWNDIKLSMKGRVYSAAVCLNMFYSSETGPLKVEDIRRLSAFDYCYLRSIGQIWCEYRTGNIEVRQRVLGPRNMSVIEQLHNHRLSVAGTCTVHVERPSSAASLVCQTL